MGIRAGLPVEDGRVRIRAMTPADADAYAAGTTDADVRAFAHLPEPEYTPESVLRMLDTAIVDGPGPDELAVLAVADAGSDAFLGSVVLFDVVEPSAEVGFWLAPEARGRGLAADTLRLAREIARRRGLTAVRARTAVDNVASQRVLERAGFAFRSRDVQTTPSGVRAEVLTYEADTRG